MNEIRNFMYRCLVALVHLSHNDPCMEINLKHLLSLRNQQIISTIATVVGNNNPTATTTTTKTNLIDLVNTLVKHIDTPSDLFNKIIHINQSDSLILTILSMLNKRDLINEHSGKLMIQYFQFFNYYASIGIQECMHLQRCDVPLVFIQFILDELPLCCLNLNLNSHPQSSYSSPYTNKSASNHHHHHGSLSQYVDLTRVYSILSVLLRCYDTSQYCSASSPSSKVDLLDNPYSHLNDLKQHQQSQNDLLVPTSKLHKITPSLAELIFKQTQFVKKLLEDAAAGSTGGGSGSGTVAAANMDDIVKMLRFLCWENVSFSLLVLNELLWMIAYHYSYELKPHLELLHNLLMIEDSWQVNRIQYAFRGSSATTTNVATTSNNSNSDDDGSGVNDRDGLFEVIAKSQNHYQKRAYQIIKALVHLFTK